MSPLSQAASEQALRERCPDFLLFTQTYSPDRIQAFADHPDRCILGNAPSLLNINSVYGQGKALMYLGILLPAWQELLPKSVSRMSVFQVESLSKNIIDLYPYLKVTEIMLFLVRFSGGRYHAVASRFLSPSDILGSLPMYLSERNEVIFDHLARQEQMLAQQQSEAISWQQYLAETGRSEEESPLEKIKLQSL